MAEAPEKAVRFIVGLGNPGDKYNNTRHNLGRRLVEFIARQKKRKWSAGRLYDLTEETPACVRLNTFMNVSGQAVLELLNEFQLNPSQVLVCFDDFDLPLGAVRIRKKGSAGSHNGLKSVIDSLGTQDFPRLRMGIGPLPQEDPAAFVLGRFSKADEKNLETLIEKAAGAVDAIDSDGIEAAMNKFNS